MEKDRRESLMPSEEDKEIYLVLFTSHCMAIGLKIRSEGSSVGRRKDVLHCSVSLQSVNGGTCSVGWKSLGSAGGVCSPHLEK